MIRVELTPFLHTAPTPWKNMIVDIWKSCDSVSIELYNNYLKKFGGSYRGYNGGRSPYLMFETEHGKLTWILTYS